MRKAEERGKTYAIHKASEKLHDYYGNSMLSVVQFDGYDIKNAYIEGYHQAERDLEFTWKDIKLIMDIVDSENLKPRLFDEIDYQEVLNRFNKYKER
jgi:hypothetical protein